MASLLNTFAPQFHIASIDERNRLLIRPLKANISRRRPNFQHRTPSIQLPLRVQRPRTPLVAFAGDVNVWEVGGNVVPIAQVDAGAH
jgi:hypothetical protein